MPKYVYSVQQVCASIFVVNAALTTRQRQHGACFPLHQCIISETASAVF